jgi:carbonic anhydrase/acetyltransferase-like protein (isoleucine patch superfamily)
MMATVLNRSVIGRESIVGASALVSEDKIIPERSLVLGVPGKVVRALTQADVDGSYRNTARYVKNGSRHTTMLEEWIHANGWRV